MFLLENTLYGITSFEKDSNRIIHLIYSGSDRKIDYKSQLQYTHMKNIQCQGNAKAWRASWATVWIVLE